MSLSGRHNASTGQHKFFERDIVRMFIATIVVESSLWLELIRPQAERYTKTSPARATPATRPTGRAQIL